MTKGGQTDENRGPSRIVPLPREMVVEDGSTQSLLIVPFVKLWKGPVDLSGSNIGGVGYPVLPISIAEEEIPSDKPPPS